MGVGSDYPELADFFLWLFLASKIVASLSVAEALELTTVQEIEQRGTDETVETVTSVSVDDGFTSETLQLWRI